MSAQLVKPRVRRANYRGLEAHRRSRAITWSLLPVRKGVFARFDPHGWTGLHFRVFDKQSLRSKLTSLTRHDPEGDKNRAHICMQRKRRNDTFQVRSSSPGGEALRKAASLESIFDTFSAVGRQQQKQQSNSTLSDS